MATQFRIAPGTFYSVRRKRLLTILPVMLLATIAGIVISYTTQKQLSGELNTLPFVIVLLTIIFSFSTYRNINRLRTLYESYVLTIDNYMITKEQQGIPTVTIYFLEIREINKSPQGYIIIRGREAKDIIYIPPELENFETMEKLLREWEPFQPAQDLNFLQRYPMILPMIMMGLMTVVFISFNKWLVGIGGILLMLVMIYSFFAIQNNKYANRLTKRFSWWYLILMFIIIINIVAKFKGFALLN
jgi:hypothetical protein